MWFCAVTGLTEVTAMTEVAEVTKETSVTTVRQVTTVTTVTTVTAVTTVTTVTAVTRLTRGDLKWRRPAPQRDGHTAPVAALAALEAHRQVVGDRVDRHPVLRHGV